MRGHARQEAGRVPALWPGVLEVLRRHATVLSCAKMATYILHARCSPGAAVTHEPNYVPFIP